MPSVNTKPFSEFEFKCMQASNVLFTAMAFDDDISHFQKTALETSLRSDAGSAYITSCLKLVTSGVTKHFSSVIKLKKYSNTTKYLLTAAALTAGGLMIGSGALTLGKAASYSWSLCSQSPTLIRTTNVTSFFFNLTRAGANTMYCLSLINSGAMEISSGLKVTNVARKFFNN